jgi:hypothetical protein
MDGLGYVDSGVQSVGQWSSETRCDGAGARDSVRVCGREVQGVGIWFG